MKNVQSLDHHTPPEIWLNEKGTDGWELVAVIERYDYTEFFMKPRAGAVEAHSSDLTPREDIAVNLARQAEKYFAENDFEKALQALKQLQQLVSEKES